MDHKIAAKKKNRFSGCIIAMLIILILTLLISTIVYYNYQKIQLKSELALAASNETKTTKVKQGALDLRVENITGAVRSKQSVNLYWRTSGAVKNVNVQVGDSVNKDDILAELDETTLDQDVLNATLDLNDAKEEKENLIDTSDDISKALSSLVTLQKEVVDAQKKLDSMDVSRTIDLNINLAYEAYLKAQNDYDSALMKFDEMRADPVDAPSRVKRLGDVGGYRSVRDNALAEYNYYLGNVDELERQTREAALLLAKAKYADALYEYEKILDGVSQTKINAAQAKIDSVQRVIDSSKITAPFSGTVTKLEAKPNDVISYDSSMAARNILAARIDDNSTFYVDFKVSELVINDIKEGQVAEISFAAIPDKIYHGVVASAANIGIKSNLSVSFDATVALTDADEDIRAGMTADVAMLIDSVENALIVPQTAIALDQGRYYVKRKTAQGDFEEMNVKTGLISGSSVQIFSDQLSAGDEIQLDVSEKKKKTGGNFPPFMMGSMGGD